MKHRDISEQVVLILLSCNLEELSNLTCSRIAEKFGINQSYFSSRFKKDTNISLFNFIEMEKIIRIRFLLESCPDLTIDHLARKFGLEKTEQFRARFKKYFYVTPGKLKHLRKNRKNWGLLLKK